MARSELSGLLAVAFLVLAIVQGRTQGLVDAGPVTLAESLVVPEAQPVGVPAAAGATTATALGPQAAATTGMFMKCESLQNAACAWVLAAHLLGYPCSKCSAYCYSTPAAEQLVHGLHWHHHLLLLCGTRK